MSKLVFIAFVSSDTGLLTYFQHPFNGFESRQPQFFLHGNFRKLILHTEVEFFQCIQFHMRTIVAGTIIFRWRRNKSFVRRFLHHLVEDTRLGSHNVFGLSLIHIYIAEIAR